MIHKVQSKAFTLVELLVVVSIISLLTLMTFSSFTAARKKERVNRRVAHLKQVQTALEYYFAVNHTYPTTGGVYRSQCSAWGGYSANNVIPNLVPTYLPVMPQDPQMNTVTNSSCYIYVSNGTDYAFIDNGVDELSVSNPPPNFLSYPELIDPARDGGLDSSIVDYNDPTVVGAWKVSSPGGRGF
jgi:prepilin-type N-terminal cleavage/methylation domain-containing protein